MKEVGQLSTSTFEKKHSCRVGRPVQDVTDDDIVYDVAVKTLRYLFT